MKETVAIIGSGPSALMLAAQLDEKKFNVTIYERNSTPGRKFLVAGNGGFNLTHSDPKDQLIEKYIPSSFFENLINSFSNVSLRNWLASIGIPTYIGSSKRVFPIKEKKPIDVLNAILQVLATKEVKLKKNHQWQGWDHDELLFNNHDKSIKLKADIVVFALGGASWRKTGSDGSWASLFVNKGIDVLPFQPSNCAFQIDWPKIITDKLEGQFLKNISVSCSGKEKKGELVITDFGLEGGAIYALSPEIRKQIEEHKIAQIFLDLKPSLSRNELLQRLQRGQGNSSWTKHIENQLNLNKTQIILLKNCMNKEEFIQLGTVADKIKNLPLTIVSTAPIDEAISTVGGVPLHEIDGNFQLKKIPGHYALGEMLDWDAPTGGYLLQACFSMGNHLALHLNDKHHN
jgi:uncharacterized flavoprotein (TIGR03862 family)